MFHSFLTTYLTRYNLFCCIHSMQHPWITKIDEEKDEIEDEKMEDKTLLSSFTCDLSC